LFLADPDVQPHVLQALPDLRAVPVGYEARGSRVLLAQLD
jgi:hypothetical protein